MPRPRQRKSLQPVKGGMRGFAEARKSNINLLNDVRTHVVAEGNRTQGEGREAHKIHVSELVKDTACPRQLFYKITEVEPTDSPKGAYHRLEFIWAAGNQEHAKWQRWLGEMGMLFGTWKCSLCEHEFEDTSPSHCPKCGEAAQFLKYCEVNLEDPTYPLVGHADGAVPDRECLVEVKSFSVGTVRIENPKLVKQHTHEVDGKSIVDIDAIWASIKRPLKTHLAQGLIYLWLCKRLGLPYKSIVYIYENKATQDTKAFEVKQSDRLVEGYVQMLEDVLQAADEGVAPERPEGFTKDLRPCTECVFRGHCYEEESDDDTSEPVSRVSARGTRSRGQAAGQAAEIPSASSPRRGTTTGSRRRDRTGRPGSDDPDDQVDAVDRAPRRATRDGRSGREVRSGGSGQGEGSRFSRPRQGRDRA